MELSLTESIFRKDMHEKLDADFDEFIHYQKLVLNTLEAFSKVCDNRHIDYYLAYGTLLGAIRDKGQIPWDYDIDVWVKQEDIERLISALDEELPDDYYYVTRYKSKEHRHYMMRITPKGYSSEVLHVDVFWLFGAPTKPHKLKRMVSLYNRRRAWGEYKYLPTRILEYNQGRIQRKYLRLKNLLFSFIPGNWLDYFHNRALNLAEPDSENFTDEYGMLLKKEWFSQKKLTTFSNGMQFCIPSGYTTMLEALYGDWKSYLSITDRVTEFQSSLQRIRAIGKEFPQK